MRGRNTDAVIQFERILDRADSFGITGVIYQEVLQGAAPATDFERLQEYLGTQRFYHPLDPVETYQEAANLYFRCRRSGITIRSTVDCLIAEIAIEHSLVLLYNDQDFVSMTRTVPELTLA